MSAWHAATRVPSVSITASLPRASSAGSTSSSVSRSVILICTLPDAGWRAAGAFGPRGEAAAIRRGPRGAATSLAAGLRRTRARDLTVHAYPPIRPSQASRPTPSSPCIVQGFLQGSCRVPWRTEGVNFQPCRARSSCSSQCRLADCGKRDLLAAVARDPRRGYVPAGGGGRHAHVLAGGRDGAGGGHHRGPPAQLDGASDPHLLAPAPGSAGDEGRARRLPRRRPGR